MDYVLHPRPAPAEDAPKPRLVPSRPSRNLRRGGGHKSVPGWTEQKRRTNRRRFNELRPFIKTGVTIIYPASATPQELAKLSKCSHEFCKEKGVPARAVLEGPGYHEHLALCIEHSPETEQTWCKRLAKRWRAVLGVEMGPDAFLWKSDIEPDKIASYLSKTWTRCGKHRVMAKDAYPWMPSSPYWETHLRKLAPPGKAKGRSDDKPRKTRGKSEGEPAAPLVSPAYSPNYTVSSAQTSENEGERAGEGKENTPREVCLFCWGSWGRSLWEGSCKCNPGFPNC